MLIESNRAVFWTRMDYEENAQYYLIWSALARRAGGKINADLVRKAYVAQLAPGPAIPHSCEGSNPIVATRREARIANLDIFILY